MFNVAVDDDDETHVFVPRNHSRFLTTFFTVLMIFHLSIYIHSQ